METAKVEIRVPKEMLLYINNKNQKEELERNALMLYPYIRKLVISHGRAAEILGIQKWELIALYDEIGLPYLDLDISDIEEELETYAALKAVRG